MTLEQWREANSLTTRAAAEKLGISHVTIWALEKGHNSPTIRTADKIERATGGAVTRLDWPKEGA